MKMKPVLLSLFVICCMNNTSAQDATALLQSVKNKIDQVNDYEATGKMKTNVAFLKVPVASIKVYFKKPDRLKVKSEKGISFVPKGAVNLNLAALLRGNKYTVIDAGADKIGNSTVRIVKILKEDEKR